VKKALVGMEAEVIVVDNASTDGCIEYLQPKFPWVKFIQNQENLGFSKANNIGLSLANSSHILFLNPDTILSEDALLKTTRFLEKNPSFGALGIKMLDGHGFYLKESKRGFPSPWVAFCKLLGLSYLFPHSALFAKYYLGNLNENENQEIDAISGAFFLTRKEVLEKVGGFDERFFMYAEDIDLSYRIQKAGYKNCFFAESCIIHFKGESTKKDSKYVRLFYSAMALFSKKHFGNKFSWLFLFLIDFAIWTRAFFSLPFYFFSKKEKEENLFNYPLTFLGDAKSIDKLKSLLEKKQPIKKTNPGSETILFCEGSQFSFGEIIDSLKKEQKKRVAFFSSESFSLIGPNYSCGF
jgi:N-acetylglucosaminyl-diphospho-decaprenol L-rhamnosyltransferase